jgi:DNA-binding beta-propeller fold protein YncE
MKLRSGLAPLAIAISIIVLGATALAPLGAMMVPAASSGAAGAGTMAVASSAAAPAGTADYTVTFTQAGLESGTNWTVTLNGTGMTVTGSQIVFSGITNGTYPFTVNATGYLANPANGTVTVNGAAASQLVTFTIVTSTVFGVIATVPTGNGPYSATYDSGNGYVYVVNRYTYGLGQTSDVTVLSGTSVVGTVNVGADPFYAAYDSGNGYIYVTNELSGNVSVISGTTVVGTLAAGTDPYYATYDSGNGYVYVSNLLSANITVIQGMSVVDTISVGAVPELAAVDSGNGYVYVPCANSANVSVISGTSVVATVPVGSNPFIALYDSGNGYVYVTNSFGSANVSVISGTSLLGTVSVGVSPGPPAYDTLNGYIYVPNEGSTNVSVISGMSLVGTVNVGGYPDTATYGDGYVYVPTQGTDNVSVINGTSVVATVYVAGAPYYGAYDSANGYVYVTDSGSASASVISPARAYAVTFMERGFTGETWGITITINGTEQTTSSSSMTLQLPNGTFDYRVTAPPNWVATHDTGTVTESNGAQTPNPVLVTFLKLVKYPVTFDESGLSGETWGITINGTEKATASTSIAFQLPNGTFNYSVSSPPGWAPASYGGNVTESDGTQSPNPVLVTFTNVTYPVTFNETGLTGQTWAITVSAVPVVEQSTASNSMTFQLPNGTFDFSVSAPTGWLAENSSGVVTESNGTQSPNPVLVTFTQVTYVATFNESTLPAGLTWAITVGGIEHALTTNGSLDTLTWSGLANGTYHYSIADISGWHQSTAPYTGTLTVDGGTNSTDGFGVGYAATLSFSPVGYSVTFDESGLPSGTSWSIVLNGVTQSGSGRSLEFASVANGTHSFAVGLLRGYTETPSVGSVTVNGMDVSRTIAFSPVPPSTYTVTFTEVGLPSGTNWSVTLNVTTHYSATETVVFSGIANGTYHYSISVPSGYKVSPASGTITVNGGAATQGLSMSSTSSSSSGLPWWTWVVIGVVIAAIIVVAVLLLVRRRRPPKPADASSGPSPTSEPTAATEKE